MLGENKLYFWLITDLYNGIILRKVFCKPRLSEATILRSDLSWHCQMWTYRHQLARAAAGAVLRPTGSSKIVASVMSIWRNCLGMAALDSGHSRVTEPPDSITG